MKRRKCRTCGEVKVLSKINFHRDGTRSVRDSNGQLRRRRAYRSDCIPCHLAKVRPNRARHNGSFTPSRYKVQLLEMGLCWSRVKQEMRIAFGPNVRIGVRPKLRRVMVPWHLLTTGEQEAAMDRARYL